ncbi:mobile genetic element [Streptococcus pneumoniae]|nr:mobile genetic element [Streptococcus pneumoniae]
MNYEASKQLTDARFKRLVGVQRTTFEEMLAVLKTAYQLKHAKGGRKPKLSLEDLLMATLQYVREYRTYEEIAADFGIHESNLIRRSRWVEVTFVLVFPVYAVILYRRIAEEEKLLHEVIIPNGSIKR